MDSKQEITMGACWTFQIHVVMSIGKCILIFFFFFNFSWEATGVLLGTLVLGGLGTEMGGLLA